MPRVEFVDPESAPPQAAYDEIKQDWGGMLFPDWCPLGRSPTIRVATHEAFAAMKEHYSDAEIAELTLMSGLFNMWNRFTRALQIELEPRAERELAACLAGRQPVRAEG